MPLDPTAYWNTTIIRGTTQDVVLSTNVRLAIRFIFQKVLLFLVNICGSVLLDYLNPLYSYFMNTSKEMFCLIPIVSPSKLNRIYWGYLSIGNHKKAPGCCCLFLFRKYWVWSEWNIDAKFRDTSMFSAQTSGKLFVRKLRSCNSFHLKAFVSKVVFSIFLKKYIYLHVLIRLIGLIVNI